MMVGEMLNWLRSSSEVAPELDLEAIKKEDLAILFKHSRTCPTSFYAQAEVRRFAARHPEIPVHTLVVQTSRELSQEVAEWTGIQHESPQVFVLRRGAVVASDSHEGVTEEFLTASVAT
jgi:bacillithiol system protein YtxJ